MAELSPQAQAVLDAVLTGNLTGPERYWARAHAAAALRAAADQVAPSDGSRRTQEIRVEMLAIATELENQ